AAAVVALCESRDCPGCRRRLIRRLGRSQAVAVGLERERLALDAKAIGRIRLALLAGRPGAGPPRPPALALLALLFLLVALALLAALTAVRQGRLIALRLLDRLRQVVERLRRILPAALQPVGAPAQLVGQRRVVRLNAIGRVAQCLGGIAPRGGRQLVGP